MKKHGMQGKQNAKKDITAECHIHIRVTAQLKEQIKSKSKDMGVSVSEFVLSAIEKQL